MRDMRLWNNDSEENRMSPEQKLTRQQIRDNLRDGKYRMISCTCPTCGGFDFDPLAVADRYGLDYAVGICRRCGLVQTSPRLDQDSLTDFYIHHYRRLYGTSVQPGSVHSPAADERGRIALSHLASQAPLLPGHTVVEIGCGAGGQLLAFQAAGCRARGYDFDANALMLGHEAAGLDLRFGGVDACLQDVANGFSRPTAVLYLHVFEHLSDPRDELRKLAELLAPQGLLYLEVPGLSQALRTREIWFETYFEFAHNFHFDRDTLQALAESCGWRCLWADDHVRAVLAPPGERQILPRDRVLATISAASRARVGLEADLSSSFEPEVVLESLLCAGAGHAQALFRVGEALFERKDPQATAYLDRAHRLDPGRGKYTFLLARAMLSFGGVPPDKVLTTLEHAAQQLPDAPWPHFHLAKAQADQRRYEEALGTYARAIRLQPNTALFVYWQAHSWKALGHLKQACDGFVRARQIDGTLAWAAYHEGLCWKELCQPGKARDAFASAYNIKPEPKFAEARDAIDMSATGSVD